MARIKRLLPGFITRSAEYENVNVEDKASMLEAFRGLKRPDNRLRQYTTKVYEKLQFLPSDCSSRLFGLNLILLCISGALFWSSLRNPHRSLREQTSMPSPVLSGIPTLFTTKHMDASLFPGAFPSIFRQEPSPEVDRAWSIISDTRPIPLSRADILAIGKDPAKTVKLSSEFGLGDDVYAGRIDVLHQLHCLNALRRESYFEYYYGAKYPGGFNDTDTKHRYHLSHCIYMLLQNILCHANTDVYTHIWTDAIDHPWPDFNIPHKCTDFRAILDWQMGHGVDEHMFVDMKRPGDQEAHHMSSYFKKVNDPERFGHLGDDRFDGENA